MIKEVLSSDSDIMTRNIPRSFIQLYWNYSFIRSFITFIFNLSAAHCHAFAQETLTELVHEATAAGYRLEIHVIGDRATEEVLDALEAVPVAPEKRPILTHCQVGTPQGGGVNWFIYL